MALVFAPAANAVLGAVRPSEAGKASGATNTDPRDRRRAGRGRAGLGVHQPGSYASPQAYVDGLIPAVWVGAAVLAVGALVALLVPGKEKAPRRELAPVCA